MPPITFRPILASVKDLNCPQCYYLEVEEARILLDCGTWENGEVEIGMQGFDETAYIEALSEIAPTLTLILISNPKPSYMGLLPLLINHLKLPATCQIFASPPTVSLGRLALREWASHLCLENDPGLSSATLRLTPEDQAQAQLKAGWKFSPPQLIKVMARLTAIRFSSPLLLSGRNAPLTLIANRAGHTLGGTVWTIRTPTNEEITYAPAWNHVKERTLDGATNFISPTANLKARQKGLLIIPSERSLTAAPKTATKYKTLLDLITTTLRAANSVLIPVDASARLIELLVLLDQHWTYSSLQEFPLCLISKTAEDLKLTLKQVYEFFGSNYTTNNPSNINNSTTTGGAAAGNEEPTFTLANFRFFTTIQDFYKTFPPTATSPIPKVVLSVPQTMSYGFSRILFPYYAEEKGNVVLLTQPGEQGSLAEVLFRRWERGQEEDEKYGNANAKLGKAVGLKGEILRLKLNKKVFLEGEELATYQEKKKAEAAIRAKQKALSDRTRRMKEAADAAAEAESSSGSSDSEDDQSEREDQDDGVEAGMDETMRDITNRITSSKRSAVIASIDAEGGLADESLVTGIYDEFIGSDDKIGPVDIYVRGPARSEFTLPIKKEDGQEVYPPLREQNRFRMFPFIEKRRKVDAYGEVVDVSAWLSRGKNESDQAEAGKDVLGKRKRDEENALKEKAEAPHKFVSEMVTVKMACSVFVMDLEGKADGRALKTLLPHLNPKKLVLIGADESATADLESTCRANTSMTHDIYTPALGESAQVGDNAKSFSIRLEESLLGTLRLRRVDDYDIVSLRGAVHLPDMSSIPTLSSQAAMIETTAEGSTIRRNRPLAILANLDKDSEMQTDDETLPPLPKTLFIGDVRLFALKKQLTAAGIPAAFAGEGVLVCGPVQPKKAVVESRSKSKKVEEAEEATDTSGGQVAVRKTKAGELALEGNPGDTFYAVRQVVYSLHAEA